MRRATLVRSSSIDDYVVMRQEAALLSSKGSSLSPHALFLMRIFKLSVVLLCALEVLLSGLIYTKYIFCFHSSFFLYRAAIGNAYFGHILEILLCLRDIDGVGSRGPM